MLFIYNTKRKKNKANSSDVWYKKYDSQSFFFLFTLAAEFTKQFDIRNPCLIFHLHHMDKSAQPALSQIERPDYSGLLGGEQTNRLHCHCGVNSLLLVLKPTACLVPAQIGLSKLTQPTGVVPSNWVCSDWQPRHWRKSCPCVCVFQ